MCWDLAIVIKRWGLTLNTFGVSFESERKKNVCNVSQEKWNKFDKNTLHSESYFTSTTQFYIPAINPRNESERNKFYQQKIGKRIDIPSIFYVPDALHNISVSAYWEIGRPYFQPFSLTENFVWNFRPLLETTVLSRNRWQLQRNYG